MKVIGPIIVLLVIAFGLKSCLSSDSKLSSDEIREISESDKVTPEGITEETKSALQNSQKINKLRKKVIKADEKIIVEKGVLRTAQAVQSIISNPHDKEEYFKNSDLQLFIYDCFSQLWGSDGTEAAMASYRATLDTDEKRALILMADGFSAFQTIKSRKPTKEECLKKIVEDRDH